MIENKSIFLKDKEFPQVLLDLYCNGEFSFTNVLCCNKENCKYYNKQQCNQNAINFTILNGNTYCMYYKEKAEKENS